MANIAYYLVNEKGLKFSGLLANFYEKYFTAWNSIADFSRAEAPLLFCSHSEKQA